jgi:hypothetical protein
MEFYSSGGRHARMEIIPIGEHVQRYVHRGLS